MIAEPEREPLTVRIDPGVVRAAKDAARKDGRKVWVWVEMALRAALNGGAGGSGARKKAKP